MEQSIFKGNEQKVNVKLQDPISRLRRNVFRDWQLLLLMILPMMYYIIFCYLPMYGILLAFKEYSIGGSIMGGEWVGLKYFIQFFESIYFWRLIKNTLLLSIYGLIFGFPVPIIFALMLNEVKSGIYRKSVQTISYIPHFISTVIVVGIMYNFLNMEGGMVNLALERLGYQKVNFFSSTEWFRALYIGSGIWQGFGFSSIIYLAAISSIDQELYSAIEVDGGNRFQKIWHITLPGIKPTVIILLILSLGGLLSSGTEKIILMYSPSNYEVSDVIGTYVYRKGLEEGAYSFATSVGFFNTIINFILVVIFNYTSKKVSETSLW